MKRRWSRLKFRKSPSRRGTAIMEAAIALPLLLCLAFGMTEYGQYFYIRTAFESAARDAARFGITATAQQGDPASAATSTLAACNITFNSSWLTIVDRSTGWTTVTDVSTIGPGDLLIFTISTTYYQLPGAYRPLHTFTGLGISNSLVVSGQCSMIKE
jgi:Flp pilus assembly protein TadG